MATLFASFTGFNLVFLGVSECTFRIINLLNLQIVMRHQFSLLLLLFVLSTNAVYGQATTHKRSVPAKSASSLLTPAMYDYGDNVAATTGSQRPGHYREQFIPLGKNVKIPETTALLPKWTIRLGLFETTVISTRTWPSGTYFIINPLDATEAFLCRGEYASRAEAQSACTAYAAALSKLGFTALANEIFVPENPYIYR